MLGLARNRKAGQEPTNLKELVENTLLLLEREMNKYRVTVDKSFQPVPEAYVNGNQIQQILLNLLINARQAMPGGGRVMIRLAHDAENDMVDLVVRDNGVGIPADKLPKIFEPFYTTKSGPDASGKGGTGLGLSMCRDIIEAHHGRIRVDSTVGKGTAFTLKLPTANKVMPREPPIASRPYRDTACRGTRAPRVQCRRPDFSNLDHSHRSHGRPPAVWGLTRGSIHRDGRSLGREAIEDLVEDPLLKDRIATLGNPFLHIDAGGRFEIATRGRIGVGRC